MEAKPAEQHVDVAGLRVARVLQAFVADEAAPAAGVDADVVWHGLAGMVRDLAPRTDALLAERLRLQAALDVWHAEHPGRPDPHAYEAFLREVGYLVDEPADVEVRTEGTDPEIGEVAGPQLVVPSTNARYALNALNARWGSLYDAFYGTDALGTPPPSGPYDATRGALVVQHAKAFLDEVLPLDGASHADVRGYRVVQGHLVTDVDGQPVRLVDTSTPVTGYSGDPDAPDAVLLHHHGLGVELRLDREHPVGRDDRAGLADVVLESAVTTIVDLEDSVATVDADDKVLAYRHWLGLVAGTLETPVTKGGRTTVRRPEVDPVLTGSDDDDVHVRARSLLLVRTVGHLMTTPAVHGPDGREVPEHLLDALLAVLCALADRDRPAEGRNSGHGSVYVVRPKMHGPAEVAHTVDVLRRVEQVLGLPERTVKVGIMDEERRTSVNLAACLAAADDRVCFVNTGFLDRTGDEMRSTLAAGPVLPKPQIKTSTFMEAYEQRNVVVALRAGLRGRAQVGKGMWAEPARMRAMLDAKGAQPEAGASTAWVPSPTAATLHALHYHRVDVAEVQERLADDEPAPLADLLTPPLLEDPSSPAPAVVAEQLDDCCQGVLGYVVRWVQQGVGCSTVPDVHDVGKMEDRATCRISSQLVTSWLHHGVVTHEQVEDALRRMAVTVDAQNAGDPLYRPLAPSYDGPAFQAARQLVLEGATTPNGYTEPALHAWRLRAKETGAATA